MTLSTVLALIGLLGALATLIPAVPPFVLAVSVACVAAAVVIRGAGRG